MRTFLKKSAGIFLVLSMLLTMLPAMTLAAGAVTEPTEEELNTIFEKIGYAAKGKYNHFEEGSAAPDNVIFEYLPLTGKISEYYKAGVGYSIPYEKYIAIVDSIFANHSDMKDYLTQSKYYDPETDTVSWNRGGSGDYQRWITLTTYKKDSKIYVQGLFLYGGDGDGSITEDMNLTEGYDYYTLYYTDENGDEKTQRMLIRDSVELVLVQTGDGLKIDGYYSNNYYIIGDALYYSSEYDGEIYKSRYYRLSYQCDPGARITSRGYDLADAVSFLTVKNNDSLWCPGAFSFELEVEVEEGYELLAFTETDAETSEERVLTKGSYGSYLYNSGNRAMNFHAYTRKKTADSPAPPEESDISAKEFEEIFSDMGISSALSRGTFAPGSIPSDNLVFWYLQTSDVISDYYNYDTGYYTMAYSELMSVLDSTFTNHSDMKAFLTECEYYDAETDTVKWFAGGAGDYWKWVPLSVYKNGSAYKVQGIFLEGGQMDGSYTDDMLFGRDYYEISYQDEFGNWRYDRMVIREAYELSLIKTDNGFKIDGYETNDFYIAEDKLYQIKEDGSKEQYYPLHVICDPGVKIMNGDKELAYTLKAFENNNNLWSSCYDYSVTLEIEDGYSVKMFMAPDGDNMKVIKPDQKGVYHFSPSDFCYNSYIRVIAEKTEPEQPDKPENVFVFKVGSNQAYYADADMALPIGTACQIKNGKTYVPFRAIAAATGINDLKFDSKTSLITFTGDMDYTVTMAMDYSKCLLTAPDGTEMFIPISAPLSINGSACLPIRETSLLTGGSLKFQDNYIIVSQNEIPQEDIQGYINAYNAKIK